MYKGFSVRLKADFSSETMEDKLHWDDIGGVLKEKDSQQRILHAAKLLLKNEKEIKWFPEKQKQWDYIVSSSAQEMKKRILQDKTRQ